MALSTYLANALQSAVLRNTSYTSPATVYVALYTTDPTVANSGTEVSGGSYARVSAAFDAPSGTGITANTSLLTFPTASGSWGTVTHFGVLDASSGGNLLHFGALSVSKVVATNDIVTVPAGDLDVTLS